MSLKPRKINFEKVWRNFKEKTTNLLDMQEFMIKGMDLYADVYDLCTAYPTPYTNRLYDSLQDFFIEYVSAKCEIIVSSNDILQNYVSIWTKFRNGASNINSLCNYLNTLNSQKEAPSRQGQEKEHKPTIEALALGIWKQHLIEKISREFGDSLYYQISQHIEADRNGEEANPHLVLEACTSFVVVDECAREGQKDAYKEYFEKKFLAISGHYYLRESSELIAKFDMSSYLRHVQKRLQEEESRMKKFVPPQTHEKLENEVLTQLISVHFERFYAECKKMVVTENLQDFGRMYEVISRVHGVGPMMKILEDHLTEVGLKELEKLGPNVGKNFSEYFETLLALHDKYTSIIQAPFKGDLVYSASIDKAFRVIVNDINRNPEAKGPELLARCCDLFLKKNSKGTSDVDLEEKLNNVITLFKYIDDKDVFQKFYSRMLARRLIYDNSVSDDAESNMISRLKTTCGFEYTSKLQRMFTDISVSKDLNDQFAESLKNRGLSLGVEFNVLILTAGAWPITQAAGSTFNIPTELERCIPPFQDFFNSRHSGRKLSWLHHLSRGDLKMTYLPKRYELQLTVYQVAVLLLFNQSVSLSFADIQFQTQLSESELLRILRSLTDVKILNANSMDKDGIFELNMGFSSKRMKLKISGPMQSETPAEKQETHQQIDVDRQLYLQALIVRIMKTRKKLHHNQLVDEIVREARSRFAPNIASIKKCVEGLIEKAYIERDSKIRDEYIYVA